MGKWMYVSVLMETPGGKSFGYSCTKLFATSK